MTIFLLVHPRLSFEDNNFSTSILSYNLCFYFCSVNSWGTNFWRFTANKKNAIKFNFASFVIEVFWIGASCIGLWKYWRRSRQCEIAQ